MAIVSRLQLNHPALGAAGGAGLHSSIEAIYTKIGDNMNDRWFTITDFDQTETEDLLHNFETGLENIQYDLWNYTGGEWVQLTEATTPARSDFTVIEKVGFEDTTLQITNNTGGNDLDFAVTLRIGSVRLDQGDVQDVDVTTTAPEDGQALVFEASSGKFKPGASGDASFKLQSITDPNAVIKGGYLLLDDGRELATYDGAGGASTDYGVDITVSLDTVLGGNPADATTYYLYIDLESLSSEVTLSDNGRKVYGIVQANFALSTTEPEEINRVRYVPIGFVRSATTGTVWSGSGAAFGTLAFRRHQNPGIIASPLAETIVKTIGTVGAADNVAGGHVLAAPSFPSALTTAKLSFYNLAADANDDFHTRNLTNIGSTPFTGTSIRGTSNAAANLDGTTHSFTSTDAFFSVGNGKSWAVGGWVAMDDWTPSAVQGIFTQRPTASDRVFSLQVNSSGDLSFIATNTAAANDLDLTLPAFVAGYANGQWHHLAMVYDFTAGQLYGYVDGVKVASGALANTRAATAPQFRIGAIGTTAVSFLDGRVQDAFFVNDALLSDEDIRKLYSVRLDLSDTSVSIGNQRWEAQLVNGDFATEYPELWLVDKDADKIYVDFGGSPAAGVLTLRKYDLGLVARTVPTRGFDKTYTSDPTGTVAHGLPAMPTALIVLHNELADGKYVPLNPEPLVKADATNLYLTTSSLTIDGTHPIRIIALVGGTSASIDRNIFNNLTPQMKVVATTYTAVNGDRIFADSSAGAFTITLPANPSMGDRVVIYDAENTWDTNNVTVARNGKNIDSAAADLTLDIEGGKAELVYYDTTFGWRVY